jgi:hypothetical protein
MNSKRYVANRIYSTMLTLAGAAVLVCGTAIAQTPTAGSMNNNPNSPQNQSNTMAMQQNAMANTPSSGTGSMQDKKFAKEALGAAGSVG